MSSCPECSCNLKKNDNVRVCEIIFCPECKTELEIVGLDPFEVALAPEVEEDWGE